MYLRAQRNGWFVVRNHNALFYNSRHRLLHLADFGGKRCRIRHSRRRSDTKWTVCMDCPSSSGVSPQRENSNVWIVRTVFALHAPDPVKPQPKNTPLYREQLVKIHRREGKQFNITVVCRTGGGGRAIRFVVVEMVSYSLICNSTCKGKKAGKKERRKEGKKNKVSDCNTTSIVLCYLLIARSNRSAEVPNTGMMEGGGKPLKGWFGWIKAW